MLPNRAQHPPHPFEQAMFTLHLLPATQRGERQGRNAVVLHEIVRITAVTVGQKLQCRWNGNRRL